MVFDSVKSLKFVQAPKSAPFLFFEIGQALSEAKLAGIKIDHAFERLAIKKIDVLLAVFSERISIRKPELFVTQ